MISDIAAMAAARTKSATARNIFNSVSESLSDDDFYEQLGRILPTPAKGAPPPKKQIREADFEHISKLLHYRGKDRWALRPRTFVVLYMTGLENAMDAFVDERRSDIFLPYQKNNLPNALTGEQRAQFLNYQEHVLTGQGPILERGGGKHQHFPRGSADTLFINRRTLGRGMAGFQTQVNHVVGRMTLNDFALKKIARTGYLRDDEERIGLFTNELDILKSLSHRHIVRLVGSYTDRDFVGLLMSPYVCP